MNRESDQKIILIKRKTRLEELIAKFNTVDQSKFYIEHLGSDFSDYLQEDITYKHSLANAEQTLSEYGRLQMVSREYVPNFIFGKNDTVVVVGQDGLVANTLKYLSMQPLIGVNPDPKRWDGVLLPFVAEDLKFIIPEVFKGNRKLNEVTLAQAVLNDGQKLYAVNDFFIGQKTHISSRYHIQYGERGENQSSSGIIVSTGLGATGWLKSVVAGAGGIVNALKGEETKLLKLKDVSWNANYLYFSIREPFLSKNSKVSIVFGRVEENKPLQIVSHMPESGVIFSDGMENDFLAFSSGVAATISVADKKGYLVT